MLKPKSTTKTGSPIETVTASCIALYMAAKAYHLNVTGPTFYGDHKTYDGIAEMSIGWYDVFAERMRFMNMPVQSSITWVAQKSIIKDANIAQEAEGMLGSMLEMLESFSAFINTELQNFDPTTQNIVQELDADIGKQIYFVRSSL